MNEQEANIEKKDSFNLDDTPHVQKIDSLFILKKKYKTHKNDNDNQKNKNIQEEKRKKRNSIVKIDDDKK
jgi:hypothetical protein